MSLSKEADFVDNKIPSWDGNWATYSDFCLRVELRADATKKDELALLGPRLAGNLTGKAFGTLEEINRDKLRSEKGWKYLLQFLEEKRGKAKIDLLGDLFTEFFSKRDTHRRDGEDLSDYEVRYRQLVRRLDKAVKESGATGSIPSELYGWMLLNVYMRLDASDAANVKGKADSYQLDDILSALKKMWSGGGLSTKDMERKKKNTVNLHAGDEIDGTIHLGNDDDSWEEVLEESDGEHFEETTAWYQDALHNLLEEPEDAQVLANFREARKALDAAKNSRGFFPVRNPNAPRYPSKGSGKQPGKGRSWTWTSQWRLFGQNLS